MKKPKVKQLEIYPVNKCGKDCNSDCDIEGCKDFWLALELPKNLTEGKPQKSVAILNTKKS